MNNLFFSYYAKHNFFLYKNGFHLNKVVKDKNFTAEFYTYRTGKKDKETANPKLMYMYLTHHTEITSFSSS